MLCSYSKNVTFIYEITRSYCKIFNISSLKSINEFLWLLYIEKQEDEFRGYHNNLVKR
jgi:hypothetical protein